MYITDIGLLLLLCFLLQMNSTPGILINHLNGHDVIKGVKIDYKGISFILFNNTLMTFVRTTDADTGYLLIFFPLLQK